MSKENITDMQALLDEANATLQQLELLEEVAKGIKPEQLKITEEQALAVRQEILDAIPEQYRFLYPEDDTLAAFAYAPIYYMLMGQ